ncbi:MAG: PqqD family peptide modification chaperone [Gemmatimonadaceae bacterium]
MPALSITSTVVVSPEQMSCELDGERAILGLVSGTYYGLNTVGSRVWELLGEPVPVYRIRDVVVEEYDVDRERCEREVVQLLEAMVSEGLIRIVDAVTP